MKPTCFPFYRLIRSAARRDINTARVIACPSGWTISAATRYLWQDSSEPAVPCTDWVTAAHVIQDAVDAAVGGDTVPAAGGGNSNDAIRCLDVCPNAALGGFRLTHHQKKRNVIKKAFPLIATWLASLTIGFGAIGAKGQGTLVEGDRNRTLIERAQWFYRQRALPNGEIPKGARQRALGQIKKAKLTGSSLTASAPTERWVSIGPAPILNGQTSPRQPVSGRVADIAIDPLDTNHWLIGAAQGGIWETQDAGANWRPLTDDQPSLATGAIAFAPGNPNIIYAGTGEAVYSSDSYAGVGLLKSEDGGESWFLLGASTFAQTSFSGIRVHPGNPDRVVVATASGVAGAAGYVPPSAPTGVYTSDNGGTNWTLHLPGQASDLEVHPADFSRQYAALGNPLGTTTNGLLQSTNGVYRSVDAGLAWNRVTGPWDTLLSNRLGRIEMALAPSDPDVLYVSATLGVEFQGPDVLSGGGLAGIWRTANAWAASPTWTSLPTPSTGPQVWYNHQLSVHPTNANVLYFGETPLHRYNGSSWTVLGGNYLGNSFMSLIHADQHAIAWAGSRLVVGNDGGVWSSIDDGVTWSNHNAGLEITQFYRGSLHPSNPNFALGGSQDNGTEKWTGSNAWLWVSFGDGGESAFSSRNPDTHWAVSLQKSTIRRTFDGSTFTDASSGIDDVNAPFVTRFAQHPALEDLFIHGTDRLWKCTNFFSGSPFWRSNSPALLHSVTTNVIFDVHTNMLPDQITALAFARSDATGNTYAYGTAFGTLRLTTNGGGDWIDLDPTNALPDRWVTDIAFDPKDANGLWLTVSSFYEATPVQPGHVFKTTNALADVPVWQNVSPPVNVPHNAIVIDPINPNRVFVGTDIGVWETIDGGENWTHMGPETGMPNVAVFDLELNEPTERLVAFTHGRGAFALINPEAASLRLTQESSADQVLPGCDLTYVVRVQNLGPRQATDVTLVDAPPSNANIISVTPSQGACAQTTETVNCDLGTLPSLSQATVTVVVSPRSEGFVTNQATVTAQEPESTPYNNATTMVAVAAVTLQPSSLEVVENTDATFSIVGGADCPNSSFQWQVNGLNLPNATNATLLLTNVSAADDGDYRVVVVNGAGMFASAPAPLTVLFLPRVVTSPQSQTVVAGEDVTFDVTASGSLPMTYEWRRLSTPLVTNTVFALSDSFTLFKVAPSQDGERYRVILRNAARPTGVASSYATLMVLTPPAPSATTEPADGVGPDQATLHGLVNPNGAPSWAFFDYGGTTNYGNQTAAVNLLLGSNATPVLQPLTRLLAETIYHYRVVATNYGGIAFGADQAFTTAAPTLRITGFEPLGDGRFRLKFTGINGTVYTVQASDNLARWNNTGTASETAPGQFEFIDAEAPAIPKRFYRLRAPQ
jgi:uncharacterized repeat protein (TIGR01451 family)